MSGIGATGSSRFLGLGVAGAGTDPMLEPESGKAEGLEPAHINDGEKVIYTDKKAPELRVIIPLCFHEGIRDGNIAMHAGHLPTTKITGSFLIGGVRQTVSDYDQYLNAPWILKAMQAAIMDGVDGIFLPIAFDTAISAAKCFGIPVVGALEAAVAQARLLCRKFSILAINEEEIAVNYRLSREYKFEDMLASVVPIDIGVLELFEDRNQTLEALVRAGQLALGHGAQAMVLGCTAMSFAARALAERLSVPVLDTHLIGLYALETQVRLGLKPSRLEYRRPSGMVELTQEEYAKHKKVTFLIHEAKTSEKV